MANGGRFLGWACLLLLVIAGAVAVSGATDYHEEFTDERAWFAQYWNAEGYIEILQDEAYRTRSVRCPESAEADLYEVDVAIAEDTGDRADGRITGLAGIEFRSNPSDEERWSYAILFDQDGRYLFFTLSPTGDTWTRLRGGETDSIRTGLGRINHVAVELGERNTYVSFNGGERIGVNAMVPRGGAVCCTVFNYDGATAARFDNLFFFSLSSSSPMGD